MFEKIEKLLDAGFTKDEILKMLPQDEPAPEPEKKAPEQKKEEPAKNENQEKSEEKPEEKDPEPFNTQPFTDAIRSMEEAMNAMNAKMQKLALSMFDGPEPKKDTIPDILIKVIDPGNVKKGE